MDQTWAAHLCEDILPNQLLKLWNRLLQIETRLVTRTSHARAVAAMATDENLRRYLLCFVWSRSNLNGMRKLRSPKLRLADVLIEQQLLLTTSARAIHSFLYCFLVPLLMVPYQKG